MNQSPLTALLFDVDGTLADTEKDGHRPAFNAAFNEFGLDWNWDVELYGKLLDVTGGKERIRYFVDNWLPDWQKPAHYDDLVVQLHKAKTRHYTERLQQGQIPLRPGVARLINEARNTGLRLAIATTTTPENVTALLQYSMAPDALDWFEVIAAGDVVPAKKPAPDIYRWAMERMQLTPDQCLAFEDSFNGLQSSRAAGLTTIVTINDYTALHDFTGAALVTSDLGDLTTPPRVITGSLQNEPVVNIALLHKLHANPIFS